MDKFINMKKIFEAAADEENAISMSKYMKDNFPFYGIVAPERKKLYQDFIKTEKKIKAIDWEFLDRCYEDEHREFQYLVYDYLLALKQYVTYEDISKIRVYVITKPWWDTIDFLCKVIGDVGLRDPRTQELMVEWSKDDNMWIKRTAIEHQLCLKDKTNPELLEKILLNSLGSDEFFINKAIGWALRDYSKIDPDWVSEFINNHKDRMSNLSIKEGSKYINI